MVTDTAPFPARKPRVVLAMREELPAGLFTDALWARLEAVAELPSRRALTSFGTEEARALLAEAEILLACWNCPPVTEAVLEAAPHLKMIAYVAASVRPVVTEAVWARGILVTSAVAAMAVPVAEFTLAAILFCQKDTFRFRDRLRATRGAQGLDSKASWDNPAIGNFGKRVGIVGASHIGRLVIGHLKHFDMEVRVHDPYLTEAGAERLGVRRMPLMELLAWADTVSLHAPALPATRHMIGREQLAAMRDGAWLINTARGWLLDHEALAEECATRRLNAFLDTVLPEPLPPESPLYDMPNVVITPHMAGAEGNELWRMTALGLTEIERFLAGEAPLHPVRREDLERIA